MVVSPVHNGLYRPRCQAEEVVVAAHLESEALVIDEVLSTGVLQYQKKWFGMFDNVGTEERTFLRITTPGVYLKRDA